MTTRTTPPTRRALAEAINARLQGIYDQPDVVAWGPLGMIHEDLSDMVRAVLEEPEERQPQLVGTKLSVQDTIAAITRLLDGAPGAEAIMFPTDQLRDARAWLRALSFADQTLGLGRTDTLALLEDGLAQTNPETDWALTQLRKYPGGYNDRIADLIVALRRMAYAKLLPDTPTIDPADPVAAYVAANTPEGLVRRPGDLLHEAFLYVMGDDHDHGEQAWHDTAAHFQQLLAQGAQPEPTDLPMDGSPAADRQLLETAVRALEDFGQDRPLATGGYRQDRLDRMAGALRTSVWLRACMNGSARLTTDTPPGPDEVRVTLDLSGTTDPETARRLGARSTLRFIDPDAPMATTGYAQVLDPRADSGELPCDPAPVPPMVGRWEMAEWDADNRVSAEPFGLQPDDMVVVAAEPDGPYQLDRAGAFYWGPNALAGKTIRWWRRASEQEVALGKPLQQTRTDTFPMVDTPAEPERRYGSPTWADFDRLQGQVLALERRLKAHDDAMVF